MMLFFACINIGLLFFVSHKIWRKQEDSLRAFYWPALLLKLMAGIGLGLVYTYYYTVGDTFVYFQDGKSLTALAREDFFQYLRFLWAGDDTFPVWSKLHHVQVRALFMAKLTSVINLISHDNYWITTLYFSFVSFIGSWLLVKIIVRLNPSLRYAAIMGFLFFPSIVFWSSGLIKESLAMASLFVLTYYFLKTWCREFPALPEWLLIVLALWLMWNLKYYFLVVFLPVTFACLVIKFVLPERLKQLPSAFSFLLWALAFALPVVIISFFKPNFYPERFLFVITSNYQEYHSKSAPDDLIYYDNLEPTVVSVVKHIPWALISSLYRPFIWEAGTWFKLVIALENTVLLILSCGALVNVRKIFTAKERTLIFACIVYVGFLAVFLALSTPNFGTLSRYRIGFLPFFFLLIAIENPLIGRLLRLRSGHLVR